MHQDALPALNRDHAHTAAFKQPFGMAFMFRFAFPRQALSFIGPELKIDGDIQSDGDVKIAGIVNGNVTARILIICKGGTLRGAANADTAVIKGELDGCLSANKVTIGANAHVVADISYFSLRMDAGAVFMGKTRRLAQLDTASTDSGASNTAFGVVTVPQGEVRCATDLHLDEDLGRCPYPILDNASAEACIAKHLCGCSKSRPKTTPSTTRTKHVASTLLRTVFTMASRA